MGPDLSRSASVHEDDDLVVVQLDGPALYAQDTSVLVQAFEPVLVGLVKIEVPLDLDLAFLEQGNDGSVIVQHLELPVHSGNRYRFHFSLENARLKSF